MNETDSHRKHHIVSLSTYILVGTALLILTAVTVGVSFIDLGGWNAVVAVGIAGIKALMVAFIFMHLWFDKRIFLVVFTTAILFLAIFIAFTMFDIVSRGDIYPGSDQPINKNAVIYDKAIQDSTGNAEPDSSGTDHTH